MGLFTREKKKRGIPVYENPPPCPKSKNYKYALDLLDSAEHGRSSGFYEYEANMWRLLSEAAKKWQLEAEKKDPEKYVPPPPLVNTNTPL